MTMPMNTSVRTQQSVLVLGSVHKLKVCLYGSSNYKNLFNGLHPWDSCKIAQFSTQKQKPERKSSSSAILNKPCQQQLICTTLLTSSTSGNIQASAPMLFYDFRLFTKCTVYTHSIQSQSVCPLNFRFLETRLRGPGWRLTSSYKTTTA